MSNRALGKIISGNIYCYSLAIFSISHTFLHSLLNALHLLLVISRTKIELEITNRIIDWCLIFIGGASVSHRVRPVWEFTTAYAMPKNSNSPIQEAC